MVILTKMLILIWQPWWDSLVLVAQRSLSIFLPFLDFSWNDHIEICDVFVKNVTWQWKVSCWNCVNNQSYITIIGHIVWLNYVQVIFESYVYSEPGVPCASLAF
jgi:hypothetical protein